MQIIMVTAKRLAAGGLAKSMAAKPKNFFGRRLIRRLTGLMVYTKFNGKQVQIQQAE